MNEKTSKRVARIAGRILRVAAAQKPLAREDISVWSTFGWIHLCSFGDLKALAASALTQTADKKRKGKRKA